MKLRYTGLGASMLVSLAAIAVVGSYQKDTILAPLDLDKGVNPIKVPFLLAADEDLKGRIELARELKSQEGEPDGEELPKVTAPPETEPPETLPPETAPPETKPPETTPPETAPPETAPPETEPPETEPPATEPPETAPPGTEPPATEPSGTAPPDSGEDDVTRGAGGVFEPGDMVDESWFDDALFIGNSRTDGLRLYARLGEADYFCSTGLSVYTVLKKECSDTNFPSQTLEELLDSRTYGKVLIGLGINESGSDIESFAKAYRNLVDLVREKQPNAVIILQSIMTCSPKKERQNAVFSPVNIHRRNEAIKAIADGETIFYIDVNVVFADGDGYLPEEFSSDGCHLYARHYPLWVEWLRSAVYDIPTAGSGDADTPAEVLPGEAALAG